jgi:ankyrin repeat protein
MSTRAAATNLSFIGDENHGLPFSMRVRLTRRIILINGGENQHVKSFLLIMIFWAISLSKCFADDLDASLFVAVEQGDSAAVNNILASGARVEARNKQGWTPLIVAVKEDRFEIISNLAEKGADVNARSTSKMGSAVLCFATEVGDLKVIQFLLDHGADIEIQNKDGTTPLYNAVTKKNLDVARLFLSKGADPNKFAYRNERGEVLTPLMAAAGLNDAEMVDLLLQNGGRLEKRCNDGSTTLMLAAKISGPEVIKLLIARGANVNATGPKGHTALIYAAYNGKQETVKLLLAAGANPSAKATDSDNPDAKDYDAAHLADQQGYPEIQQLIIEAQQRVKTMPE